MPKIKYKELRLGADALGVIAKANAIIADYQSQGFSLSLRQLYYVFVAQDLFPDDRKWTLRGSKWVRDDAGGTKNAEPNYKWIGDVIDKGRLSGLVDWDAIEDRTRMLRENSHWSSPQQILDACASSYRVDLWENQKVRPQVWVEKDALIGVIESACSDLDVPCFSCRGYSSQSAMWRAGQLIRAHAKARRQRTMIFHLGDHDPSGVDMSRDISERLALLSQNGPVEVKRIALNMDQVRQYNPPPNPAKLTDVRSTDYIAKFGEESWELDALDPKVLIKLIRKHVLALRDVAIYDKDYKRQEQERTKLQAVSRQWNDLDLDVEEPEEKEEEDDDDEEDE
jgi:hypothetical protein